MFVISVKIKGVGCRAPNDQSAGLIRVCGIDLGWFTCASSASTKLLAPKCSPGCQLRRRDRFGHRSNFCIDVLHAGDGLHRAHGLAQNAPWPSSRRFRNCTGRVAWTAGWQRPIPGVGRLTLTPAVITRTLRRRRAIWTGWVGIAGLRQCLHERLIKVRSRIDRMSSLPVRVRWTSSLRPSVNRRALAFPDSGKVAGEVGVVRNRTRRSSAVMPMGYCAVAWSRVSPSPRPPRAADDNALTPSGGGHLADLFGVDIARSARSAAIHRLTWPCRWALANRVRHCRRLRSFCLIVGRVMYPRSEGPSTKRLSASCLQSR